jgi:cytochrome c-type biogenesis protein CcmH
LRSWGGGLALLLALAAAPVCPSMAGTDATPAGVDYVTGKIVCDCGCSNLTVKNCTCGKADMVRAQVAQRLAKGETPEQVLKSYVEEFGEQILAAPTPEGFNLVGWVLPFGAVLLAGTLLVFVLRRWARVPWSEAPLVPPLPSSTPASSPDPSFLRRVQEELDDPER